MSKTQTDNSSSNKQISIIIAIIIFVLILAIALPKVASRETKGQVKGSSTSGGATVEVIDSNESMMQTGSGTGQSIQSSELDENLGGAKVDDVLGGSDAADFQSAPSTEKLLDGKDIEVE